MSTLVVSTRLISAPISQGPYRCETPWVPWQYWCWEFIWQFSILGVMILFGINTCVFWNWNPTILFRMWTWSAAITWSLRRTRRVSLWNGQPLGQVPMFHFPPMGLKMLNSVVAFAFPHFGLNFCMYDPMKIYELFGLTKNSSRRLWSVGCLLQTSSPMVWSLSTQRIPMYLGGFETSPPSYARGFKVWKLKKWFLWPID